MTSQQRTSLTERQKILSQSRQQFAANREDLIVGFVNRVRRDNRFYKDRFSEIPPTNSLKDIEALPLTRKSDLVTESDYSANLTYDLDEYNRFHRTSGTTGRPMAVLDTEDDWQWWMEGWQYVLDAASVTRNDRILMAFSFGPFVGFWSAFDAAVERGCLVVPTGAMNTDARLDLICRSATTVVFCTPSYALHMAQVANASSINLQETHVRTIVVAGEPGGSVPEIRNQIEASWGAEVVDHAGATEVGPWGFADESGNGLYVNEALFYPEFLDADSGQLLKSESDETEGNVCQLVLTTIGRMGCPVIRYVTGDLVRPTWETDSPFVFFDGGVLGRADDMMIVRGVNVFPASIEKIIRGFSEVDEFQMIAWRDGEMDQLKIKVEDQIGRPERIASEIQLRLGLRVEVEVVGAGTLPRFEMKGKRFVDQR